jgi:hypothetical protein
MQVVLILGWCCSQKPAQSLRDEVRYRDKTWYFWKLRRILAAHFMNISYNLSFLVYTYSQRYMHISSWTTAVGGQERISKYKYLSMIVTQKLGHSSVV